MTDALYERYKDALRRGHVAAIRERFDAALVAYSEAAEIAPERALPHSSLGSILARLGRREEALAAYGRALDRVPRDETSLAGRAELLTALGRPADAATDLDLLADTREAAGKLAEASDTVLEALRLAESKARRRHLEAIVRRLREMPDEAAAAAALERALGIVGPGMAQPGEEASGGTPTGLEAAAAHTASEGPEAAAASAAPEPLPDGALLTAEAEDLLDAGDTIGAQERLLLAELYLQQGWRAPAADKLVLLGRLVELNDDIEGRARVCALAADHFPDDERLAALCA